MGWKDSNGVAVGNGIYVYQLNVGYQTETRKNFLQVSAISWCNRRRLVEFDWDENKNQINIERHGFDFSDAHKVFDHPMLVNLDTREDYGEDRWIGIGLLMDIVVAIIFTEPNKDTIRIISARKADKNERKRYYEKIFQNRLESTKNYD